MLKGDALVSFLKEPSVALACQIYDGALFRHTMGTPMTVTPAKFEMKAGDYKPKAAAVAAGGKGGGGKGRKQALEKLEKRLQWGGFDDKLPPGGHLLLCFACFCSMFSASWSCASCRTARVGRL